MSVEVTVFTPTYNRGFVIENLYKSLKRQTNMNFEWIVIDDGSVDNTEILFRKWMSELNDFKITYQKVENGGKHRAINKAVKMASAEVFFIVDSDDYLIDSAIEHVIKWFETIRSDNRYAGISGLKGENLKQPMGGWGKFDTLYIDITNLERKNYGLLKDKAEVYKTSILKKYPFPEYPGENFITESVVWNAIAKEGYKLRWYNKIIYICQYLENGLTRSGYIKNINNPRGTMADIRLSAQIYGQEYGRKRTFRFYFVLRNRYNSEKVKEMLELDAVFSEELEEQYQEFLWELEGYFKKHNIKDVAIYGLGNVGNVFLEIADKIKINVKYGIDRQKKELQNIRVISPEEEYDDIDVIVITVLNYDDKIEKILKDKRKKFLYWRDISYKYWCVSKL